VERVKTVTDWSAKGLLTFGFWYSAIHKCFYPHEYTSQ